MPIRSPLLSNTGDRILSGISVNPPLMNTRIFSPAKYCIVELLILFSFSFKTSGQELWMPLAEGGKDNVGTIAHYVPSTSSFTTDFTFTFPYPGAVPLSGMVEANNRFYGVTSSGGEHDAGVIYEWDPLSKLYTKLFDFDNTNGSKPGGPLTLVHNKLYGITGGGGIYSGGVIFEWDLSTRSFRKMFDFYPAGGIGPGVALTYYDNKFYGATTDGGEGNRGTLFEWDRMSGVFVKKIDLASVMTGSIQGAALTLYNGKLYGATWGGGAHDAGVLFEWDPHTNNFVVKIDSEQINGSLFSTTMTLFNGKLYGSTYNGGSQGAGVIFEWDPVTNVYTKKVDLMYTTGHHPSLSPLVFVNGKGYGVTMFGGPKNMGILYEWDPVSNVYTPRASFHGTQGTVPVGALVHKDGSLYGITISGGGSNMGVIFGWNMATGKYTKYADFNGSLSGSNPRGALIFINGKFYGTTFNGGSHGGGVLFEWDPSVRVFKKKIDFNNTIGTHPQGMLVKYNGKFYGVAEGGGRYGFGTIFEWDPVTNVCVKKADFDYTTGASPVGSLTYSRGKFYGFTAHGRLEDWGVLFEWNPVTNALTGKVDFSHSRGTLPQGQLINVNDKLYGVTRGGGNEGGGVIFRYDPASNEYVVQLNFPNGTSPQALTYANNKFYGVTEFGGINNTGTIFEWVINSPEYTKRIDLAYDNGALPRGPLTWSNKGLFYGMTHSGGVYGSGVLFEWNPVTNQYRKLEDLSVGTGSNPAHSRILEVYNVPLPPVFVMSPADGATDQKIKLNVISKPVKDAATYTIQLSRARNFGSGVLTKSGAYRQSFDSLRYNSTYYARVRTNLDPRFGKVTSFRTVGPEYYSYVIAPRDNLSGVRTSTFISSNAVLFATSYTIQLSENADFSLVSFSQTANTRSIFFSGLKHNTRYYTRVRTNLTALWGRVGSFTTVEGSTATARLLLTNDPEEPLAEIGTKVFAVTAHPNPFNQDFSVWVESETEEEADVQLLDLQGRELYNVRHQTNTWIRLTTPVSPAIYVLRVTAGYDTETIRLMKER